MPSIVVNILDDFYLHPASSPICTVQTPAPCSTRAAGEGEPLDRRARGVDRRPSSRHHQNRRGRGRGSTGLRRDPPARSGAQRRGGRWVEGRLAPVPWSGPPLLPASGSSPEGPRPAGAWGAKRVGPRCREAAGAKPCFFESPVIWPAICYIASRVSCMDQRTKRGSEGCRPPGLIPFLA